jgi:hypothetical protein
MTATDPQSSRCQKVLDRKAPSTHDDVGTAHCGAARLRADVADLAVPVRLEDGTRPEMTGVRTNAGGVDVTRKPLGSG